MIGKTIFHYKIVQKLGSGGMGVVYKALDTKLDRFVALKFLTASLSENEELRKRFSYEAKAASAFDHPNICTVYEINETDDGQLFIAMAFYEGEALNQKIQKGLLELDEVTDIAIQAAQGLARAHESDIIHRDIKPANIMITNRREVKILDFGLAKLSGQIGLTKVGTVVGTVAYMSPEQSRGDEVDKRTDIWSLGVVLYEMITGELPFRGNYEQAMIYSILNEAPKPISDIRSGAPKYLKNIASKALAKDTGERYQNVDDILTDLTSIKKLGDSDATQLIVTEPKRSSNWKKFRFRSLLFFLILTIVGTVYFLYPSTEVETDKKRIAVLPFANNSPAQEDEYIADSMTDELISSLSKIKGLRVIARTSVMQYKDGVKTVAEIGHELKVGTLLEGSVLKDQDKLHIAVKLIDVEKEVTLWPKEYDLLIGDVVTVLSDISKKVTEELKVRLLEEEKKQIEKTPTKNPEAFISYRKGRYNWDKRTHQAMIKSIDYYNEAIEKDSSFALAYTGIADAYALLGTDDYGVLPPKEAMPKAKKAALRSVELDQTLGEAHASLANVKFNYDWDWEDAEKEYVRAIELNPNYFTAHHGYAQYLIAMGREEEAMAQLEWAREIAPVSLVVSADLALFLYYSGKYEQAEKKYLETIELDPNFPPAYIGLALTYGQMKIHTKAIEALEKAKMFLPNNPLISAVMGYSFAASGDRKKAQSLLKELNGRKEKQYISSLYFALIYIGLNEIDEAFEWMEKAYEERSNYLIYFKVNPILDNLRRDPRFITLLKNMKLD